MWFCPCWGGTLFWPKVNIQYLPEQVASYTSYFFPNWEPHAKFQAILTGRFWDLWKKYHFLGMGAPHYTRRQTGPSPAGNDKGFDKIRKKPWSWPPSGQVCALWRFLAYVVEGHASACPRTVGVSESVWRWRYRCYVELVVRKVVSTENFGVKEKETSLNISGLAQKPRERRIKIKLGHCACHLAGTSSSPPQGGRWNVLNCFLLNWINTPNI